MKPAALVIQPEPKPEPTPEPNPKLEPDSVASNAQPAAPAGLRVPLGPTGEPDIRSRLMADLSPREAQIGTTTRGIKLPPVVHSETPPASRPAEVQQAQPPVRYERRSAIPPTTQSVSTPGPNRSRHVILRVRIAELNRSAARKWPIMDLSFTKPELLEPLLKAESGNGAIVVENLNFDQIESQLQALRQRDVVEIRSRPTMVTASGRPTRFVADGLSGMPLTGSGSQTSATAGDLPAEITLLPVVTDPERIQLEIACNASGSASGSIARGNPASVTLPETTKVQMRAGQTVVIGGLKSEPSERKPQQQGSSITQLLGIGKPEPKATEFVLLVTPELLPNTKVARPAPTIRESDLLGKSNRPSLLRKNPLAGLWGLVAPGKDTEIQPDN